MSSSKKKATEEKAADVQAEATKDEKPSGERSGEFQGGRLSKQELKAHLEQVASALKSENETGALRRGIDEPPPGMVGGPVTDALIAQIAAIVIPLGEAGIRALIIKLFPMAR